MREFASEFLLYIFIYQSTHFDFILFRFDVIFLYKKICNSYILHFLSLADTQGPYHDCHAKKDWQSTHKHAYEGTHTHKKRKRGGGETKKIGGRV